jgi:hypothetical protein
MSNHYIKKHSMCAITSSPQNRNMLFATAEINWHLLSVTFKQGAIPLHR